MSDFLLCTDRNIAQDAGRWLCEFTQKSLTCSRVIEGNWGCLIYTRAMADGFDAWETDNKVFFLVGTPELSEQLASGEFENKSSQYTELVARASLAGTLDPMRDLLQPFSLVEVDKTTGTWSVTTDCMLFIPVYVADKKEGPIAVSSHPEVAMRSVNPSGPIDFDDVSACDLIMHHTVAHPYTLYRNVRVLNPGTTHRFSNGQHTEEAYWLPYETYDKYATLQEAADAANASIVECVLRAISHGKQVSLLLSAGEDSRTLACMASQWGSPQCVSVAPSENRESYIASRVAKALGLPWTFVMLKPAGYVSNLAEGAFLAGSTGILFASHFVGQNFDSTCLSSSLVFGGFKADTFLKAYKYPIKYRVPGVPLEFIDVATNSSDSPAAAYVDAEIVTEVKSRRESHSRRVQALRPTSYKAWRKFWPLTQDRELPYFTANRRMFHSVEPFMSPGVVQVAASVPVEWLLNRKLFHATTKKHLRKLWWMPHGDGRYPAFGYRFNLLASFFHAMKRKLTPRSGDAPWQSGAWIPTSESTKQPEFETVLAQSERGILRISTWCPAIKSLLSDPSIAPETKLTAVQVAAVMQAVMK